jgi:hypothetical protein
MRSDKPLANGINERAKKHERIIAVVWLVVGVVFFLMTILPIAYLYLRGESVMAKPVFPVSAFAALAYMLSGYSLLKNLFWAHWLCLPVSIVSLLYFPMVR